MSVAWEKSPLFPYAWQQTKQTIKLEKHPSTIASALFLTRLVIGLVSGLVVGIVNRGDNYFMIAMLQFDYPAQQNLRP